MSKPGMILILYKGEELTSAAAVAIAAACKQYGIVDTAEDLTVVYKDAKGIADMIAGMNITTDTSTAQTITEQIEIEEAVDFIGRKFCRHLIQGMASGVYRDFVIALSIEMSRDEAVKHAVKTIATKKGKISKALQSNNNFNSKVVDIIKQVYKHLESE